MNNLSFPKIAVFVLLSLAFSVGVSAQAKQISNEQYSRAINSAVRVTNIDYPVIFTVETEEFENGESVRKTIEIVEDEGPLKSRKEIRVVDRGTESRILQVLLGEGNYFCKNGNADWKRSKYECNNLRTIYGPSRPEMVEYSEEESDHDGGTLTTYKEYSVFTALPQDKRGKTFRESIATLDSRGYFVSMVDTEGTLDPKNITLTRKQTWKTKAKIFHIVAPIF